VNVLVAGRIESGRRVVRRIHRAVDFLSKARRQTVDVLALRTGGCGRARLVGAGDVDAGHGHGAERGAARRGGGAVRLARAAPAEVREEARVHVF